MVAVPLLAALAVPDARAADFEHALIIILDDIGTDKVGAYAGDVTNPTENRPETPTMDLLANAGVRFTDAWATPFCSPTRAMVLAGTYPYRNGVGHALDPSEDGRLTTITDTLPQLAADSGLRTALLGKWHLGISSETLDAPGQWFGRGEYPIRLGFDYFAGNLYGSVGSYDDWLYTVSEPFVRGSWRYRTTVTEDSRPVTSVTTDDAVDWMERDPTARRLTVVSYNLAHTTAGASRGVDWDDGARVCGAKSGDDVENMKVMTECADSELMTLLRSTPDLEDTLVILFADNGTVDRVAEGNFDDGRGKGTVYESGVRVPLIIADGAAVALALRTGGGLPPKARFRIDDGTTVSDPASLVDLFATVADFLDLSSPTCTIGATCAADSTSLRSLLTGGAPTRTDLWTETFVAETSGMSGRAAIRQGDMKLVLNVNEGTSCVHRQMYDLAADRWEQTNLYDDPAYAVEQDQLLDLLSAHEANMRVAWLPEKTCGS